MTNVTLLDVNLLVALAWPNHTASAAAHRWFGHHAVDGWAMCTITQLAFVRHSINPNVVRATATTRDALQLLRKMCAAPGYVFWPEIPIAASHDTLWSEIRGHQQVTDAYLIALAKHHGGRVATFDRGLAAMDPERVELLTA